uniref:protein-serine/threonine phosphatase n=1 Tax=Auxenochlorella protothecoides TaxID=3075 RepID=A0A1D1ZU23_AUXPR
MRVSPMSPKFGKVASRPIAPVARYNPMVSGQPGAPAPLSPSASGHALVLPVPRDNGTASISPEDMADFEAATNFVRALLHDKFCKGLVRNVENLCPSVHKALRAVDGAMSRILARHGLQAFPLQGKAATVPGGVPNPLLAVPDDVRERLYRNMHRLRAVANKLPSPFPPALRACAALAVSLLRQNFFTQGQARILLPLWEGEAGQGGLEPDSTTSPDPGPAASAVKGSGKGNSGPAETAGRPADADQGAPTQDQPGVGRGSGGRPPLPPQQERWRMQGQAPLASCAVSGRERDADLAEAAGQPGPSFVLPIDPRRAPAAGRKGARGPSAVASAPHIPDRVASGTGADPRQTRVNSREPPATMAQAPQSGAGQGAGTPALAAREAGSVPEKRPVGMEGFGAAAMPARRPAAHPAAPQPAGDPTERCPTPPGVARPGEAVLQSVQPQAAQNLLRRGKLSLVLDLDHTLLNSCTFADVDQQSDRDLLSRLLAHLRCEAAALGAEDRQLFRLDDVQVWTKLRPGVRAFLAGAAELFEMTVHTNGRPDYAAAVMHVLDPDGKYFGSRVVAQGGDCLKTLEEEGLAGLDAVAVIVDDNHTVWPRNAANLVAVEQYHYFPSSRTRQGLHGPALLDLARDESVAGGMLDVTLGILRDVHAAFWAALCAPPRAPPAAPDVRPVLAERRRAVLAGVRLVFSHVIPLGAPAPSHPLWVGAERFGAQCSLALETGSTTHLLAGNPGTEKVIQARAAGIWVVTQGWLECSQVLWRRADERRFELR